MPVTHWLRDNAEHYLLVAAQDRVGRQYGAGRPRRPQGLRELFWLRLFAPVYRILPWTLRSRVLRAMPGSHRQHWASWAQPPSRREPGV
ncbi:MAG TPA: hypothetical protein VFR13_04900 [Jiangellaceae bacterium]|nr:hypothetical protein [Jiangellaceae bacterium]